jgi:hypothetical protein
VHDLQDAKPMRVVARSRVGMSIAGMRAVGFAGACFHGAAAGSLMRRSRLEVLTCPRGYQDQAGTGKL